MNFLDEKSEAVNLWSQKSDEVLKKAKFKIVASRIVKQISKSTRKKIDNEMQCFYDYRKKKKKLTIQL